MAFFGILKHGCRNMMAGSAIFTGRPLQAFSTVNRSCSLHHYVQRQINGVCSSAFQCNYSDNYHPARNFTQWNFKQRFFHSTPRSQFGEADTKTTALTVWKNLSELKSSPTPALVLGLSGLLPFAAAPAYMLMSSAFIPEICTAQVVYGATILSFLGGVRWGFALPQEGGVRADWTNLGYSVVPSLVAWVGLLLPSPFSLFTVMGGLGVTAYFDTSMWGYPMWFKALRFTLSFVAILSLWTTFVCSLLLGGSKKETPPIQDLNPDTK